MDITTAKTTIIDALQDEIDNIDDAKEKVLVEQPLSIENYKLSHPKGSLLVIYRGSTFEDTQSENSIIQNRNIEIGVIAVIRASYTGKTVEEWVQFIIDTVSGLWIKADYKQIYVSDDEFIKEENGVWWYAVTVRVPTRYMTHKEFNQS